MQMKNSLIVILYLLFSNASIAGCKSHNLILVKATSQDFVGGAAGSPSGTTYSIKFIAPVNSKKLQIDQVWIGGAYYEVQAFSAKRSGASASFAAGDTIEVTARKLVANPMHQNIEEAVATQTKPFEYSGAAIVGYKIGKKQKYLKVEKLETLKRENYQ